MCYIVSESLTKRYRNRKTMWKVYIKKDNNLISPFQHAIATDGEWICATGATGNTLDNMLTKTVDEGVFHGLANKEDAIVVILTYLDCRLGYSIKDLVIIQVKIREIHSAGLIKRGCIGEGCVSIGAKEMLIPENAPQYRIDTMGDEPKFVRVK